MRKFSIQMIAVLLAACLVLDPVASAWGSTAILAPTPAASLTSPFDTQALSARVANFASNHRQSIWVWGMIGTVATALVLRHHPGWLTTLFGPALVQLIDLFGGGDWSTFVKGAHENPENTIKRVKRYLFELRAEKDLWGISLFLVHSLRALHLEPNYAGGIPRVEKFLVGRLRKHDREMGWDSRERIRQSILPESTPASLPLFKNSGITGPEMESTTSPEFGVGPKLGLGNIADQIEKIFRLAWATQSQQPRHFLLQFLTRSPNIQFPRAFDASVRQPLFEAAAEALMPSLAQSDEGVVNIIVGSVESTGRQEIFLSFNVRSKPWKLEPLIRARMERAVEPLGGHIEFNTRPGKGRFLTLYLPRPASANALPLRRGNGSQPHMKLMLVTDPEYIQSITEVEDVHRTRSFIQEYLLKVYPGLDLTAAMLSEVTAYLSGRIPLDQLGAPLTELERLGLPPALWNGMAVLMIAGRIGVSVHADFIVLLLNFMASARGDLEIRQWSDELRDGFGLSDVASWRLLDAVQYIFLQVSRPDPSSPLVIPNPTTRSA